MLLETELGFRNAVVLLPHKALLSAYYTSARLKKRAAEFLRPFGLTDVHFNVLMLLQHQSEPNGGLSQAQLSRMMLVNRADITSVIDRMEKAKLVNRTAIPADRRCNIIKLTSRGKHLLAQIEPLYFEEVKNIMNGLSEKEQTQLVGMLEKIRTRIANNKREEQAARFGVLKSE